MAARSLDGRWSYRAPDRNGSFITYEREFDDVLGHAPRLELVAETDGHEGPVYVGHEDALYFTTRPRATHGIESALPEVAIKRLQLSGDRFPVNPREISVVRSSSNMANGMALDCSGHLLICEQGAWAEPARIARFDPASKNVRTIVKSWHGLPLNSPNDLVVKGDGTIWFTDPSYGYLQGFKNEPLLGDYVYRYDPAMDRLSVVADSFEKPNGLAFSPDESVLYIGDSGANQEPGSYHVALPHHIVAFDVDDGRRLLDGRLFAVIAPGFPDGIKVDSEGRIYTSASSGVEVFNRHGDLIGEIWLPGAVNFCFGGAERNVLFITADTGIWAASFNATGRESKSVTDSKTQEGA
jgi:gluconolactonase